MEVDLNDKLSGQLPQGIIESVRNKIVHQNKVYVRELNLRVSGMELCCEVRQHPREWRRIGQYVNKPVELLLSVNAFGKVSLQNDPYCQETRYLGYRNTEDFFETITDDTPSEEYYEQLESYGVGGFGLHFDEEIGVISVPFGVLVLGATAQEQIDELGIDDGSVFYWNKASFELLSFAITTS